MKELTGLVLIVAWICGVAVAKGFWMTLAAFCFPPVAWVLLAMEYMP